MPGFERSCGSGGPGRSSRSLGCHDRALGLLAVRPRSRRELQIRLLRAGFDAAEVDEELLRLETVGLIDDEAFAAAVVKQQLSVRRAGRRAVADALYAKGLSRERVEEALAEMRPGDEEERAIELARTKVPRLGEIEPEVAYRRLIGFLARRGYPPSVARSAAARALGTETDPE